MMNARPYLHTTEDGRERCMLTGEHRKMTNECFRRTAVFHIVSRRMKERLLLEEQSSTHPSL